MTWPRHRGQPGTWAYRALAERRPEHFGALWALPPVWISAAAALLLFVLGLALAGRG
jgi:hypothetical protein